MTNIKVNKENISILDLIIIFIKNKKILIGATVLSMVIFYLLVYFFVDEKFDSTAIIIPSQESSMSGLSGLLGGLNNLPFDITGGSSNPEVGLYKTIISSRTTIDTVINRFDLWKVYKLNKNKPKDVKRIREAVSQSISAEETDDGAFTITVRTNNPYLSSDITNFLVKYINNKIILLKVTKAKNNKIFLKKRLDDIKHKLALSEDSLKNFQEKTGFLIPEEQIKNLVTAYGTLEQKLFLLQIQQGVLEKIYSKDSPRLKSINEEVKLFQSKFNNLKARGQTNSVFIPYSSIPEKSLEYYRYYRNIEINQAMLKFIWPLYEQAKYDEQKKLPILQVIDKAIPEEVKVYPPRLLLTLAVGFGVFFLVFILILIKENENIGKSEKIKFIRKNLFKWKV